jgi:hypothetical protein
VRVPRVLEDVEEPTVRDRPVGLILIAGASALAGIAILLAAVELFAGAFAYRDWTEARLVGNDLVGMVQVYPEHYLVVGAILLVPGAYILGFAAGIARQRPWAWVMGIVTGGLFALYGLLALVIPADAAADSERWHPAASLPWLVLGLALLWYFNRRVVKVDLAVADRTFG